MNLGNLTYFCEKVNCPLNKKCLAFMQGGAIKVLLEKNNIELSCVPDTITDCPYYKPMDYYNELNKSLFDDMKQKKQVSVFMKFGDLYQIKLVDEAIEKAKQIKSEKWILTANGKLVCDNGHIHKFKKLTDKLKCDMCDIGLNEIVYTYMKDNNLSGVLTKEHVNILIDKYPDLESSIKRFPAYYSKYATYDPKLKRFTYMKKAKSGIIFARRILNLSDTVNYSKIDNTNIDQIKMKTKIIVSSIVSELIITNLFRIIDKIQKDYINRFIYELDKYYYVYAVDKGVKNRITGKEYLDRLNTGKQVSRKSKSLQYDDIEYFSSNSYDHTNEELINFQELSIDAPIYDFASFVKISATTLEDYIISQKGLLKFKDYIRSLYNDANMNLYMNKAMIVLNELFYKIYGKIDNDPFINISINIIIDVLSNFFEILTKKNYESIDITSLYKMLVLCTSPNMLYEYSKQLIFTNDNTYDYDEYIDYYVFNRTVNNKPLTLFGNITSGAKPFELAYTYVNLYSIQLENQNLRSKDIIVDDTNLIDIALVDGEDVINIGFFNTAALISLFSNIAKIDTNKKLNSNNTTMFAGVVRYDANDSYKILAKVSDNNKIVFRTKSLQYTMNNIILLALLRELFLLKANASKMLKSNHRLNIAHDNELMIILSKYYEPEKWYKELVSYSLI